MSARAPVPVPGTADHGIHLERVVVETGRYRLTGSITVPDAGYRSRVSDLFNASDRDFIALSDVEVEALDSADPPAHRDFLAVNRRQVVFVTVAE